MSSSLLKNLIILVLYMSVFQDYLQNKFEFLKNFDEFLAYSLFFVSILYLLKLRNFKILKIHFKLISILFLLISVGLLGNVIYPYSKSYYFIYDIIIVCKPILTLIATSILCNNFNFSQHYPKILKHAKILSTFIIFTTIADIIFNIFPALPSLDSRYLYKSITLFFSHPTYLAGSSILLISVLIASLQYKTKNIFYIFGLSLVVLATERTKAIAFVLCIYAIMFIVLKLKHKIGLKSLSLIGIVIMLLSYSQISQKIIGNDSYARNALYVTSSIISKDSFPIGTGFGTFGSYVSGKYYSSIYFQYGISNIYGLTPQNPKFVSDTFYPMILGQFGYMGLFLFLLLLFIILRQINKITDNYNYLVALSLFIYLLISSTSESSLVNITGVYYFFFIGLFLNIKLNQRSS